jgi:hypothetical protein
VIHKKPDPTLWCAGAAVLISLVQAGVASAGANYWTTNGPVEDYIYALAVDPLTPSTVYAGTVFNGVYKSVDSGDNWNPINTGLPAGSVYSIGTDPLTPSTLYAVSTPKACLTPWTAGRNGPPSTPG